MPTFTAPDGLELTYDVEGERPPVVLHHGFADSTGADRLALAAIQRAELPPRPT